MGCRCVVLQCDLDTTFDFGFAKIFSVSIFETYFSNHKDMDSCKNLLLDTFT